MKTSPDSRSRYRARTAALALALGAAALAGCQAPAPDVGTVALSLASVQDVTRVTVTISGPGVVPDREVELVQTGGVWGGIIGEIPAGADRSFRAVAYDASDTALYQGQADGITIIAGQAAVVMIVLQELGPAIPPSNAAPVIDFLTASANAVAPGEAVALTATAHDADGDPIVLTWNATGGGFGPPSDSPGTSAIAWSAPGAAGLHTLTVTATDVHGAQAAVSFDIDVQDAHAGGSAVIGLTFVSLPDLFGVTAVPGQLTPSSPSVLLDVLVDPTPPNPLAFAWTRSACGGGAFADTGTASSSLKSPLYTASPGALAAPGTCRFQVTVTDTVTGAASQRVLVIGRGPSPVNAGPRILITYQSAAAVAPGGTLLFRAEAEDPEAQPLSFAWSAGAGSFAAPVETATTSEVIWTAPSCADAAIAAGVTATDAAGLTDSAQLVPITLPPGTGCAATGWVLRDQLAMPGDLIVLGSMTSDPGGALYVAGVAPDAGGVHHEIVRKSTDGLTWSTVRDLTPPEVTSSDFVPAVAATAGAVYMTRHASERWLVDRSSDGGLSWANVDDFQLAPGKRSDALTLSVDASGAVYVAGRAQDGADVEHCVVRRSADGGATWTTFVDYQPGPSIDTRCDLAVLPGQDLVLFGSARPPGGTFSWWVRRSGDGGVTWQLTDDFQLVAGEKSFPRTAVFDGAALAIAGYGFDGTNGHWVTRTSLDGGVTWQLTDDFVHWASSSHDDWGSTAAAVDLQGNLRISGLALGALPHRISSDGGLTWTDAADAPLSWFQSMHRAGARLFASGLVFDLGTLEFTTAAVFEYLGP